MLFYSFGSEMIIISAAVGSLFKLLMYLLWVCDVCKVHEPMIVWNQICSENTAIPQMCIPKITGPYQGHIEKLPPRWSIIREKPVYNCN